MIYAVVDDKLAFEATFDRVIVLQDEYRSGRECSACDGSGHTKTQCHYCRGTGYYKGNQDDGPCPDCSVGTSALKKSLGYELCELCKGSGTSSIIIPDNSQTRPTTGKIISLGPLANSIRIDGHWEKLPLDAQFKLGDKVLFTNYTGNIFELGTKNEVKIRYLKAGEILGKLHGVMVKTPQAGEFSELAEAGVQLSD